MESVSERLGAGGGDFHPVVLTIRGTAQDYQGDAADDWRATTAYRPPAPRPADPDQEILRPGNVAVASSVPLQLGGDRSPSPSRAASGGRRTGRSSRGCPGIRSACRSH